MAMIMVFLGVWWARVSPEVRPIAAAPGRSPTVVPREGSAASAAFVSSSLGIRLRALRRSRYLHNVPPIPFAAAWPDAHDAAWDFGAVEGLATPSALQALSAGGKGTRFGDAAAELVSTAHDEGFLGPAPDVSTPESALTSLYAAWVEMEVDHLGAFDTFLAANLAPGETWESISPAARTALLERPEAPRDEVGPVMALAEQVLARWPDHPVADHARFVLMRAEMPRAEGATWRAGEIARLLEAIGDPRVREQAAMTVTGAGAFFDAVDGELLDTLARVPASSAANELRLLTWGVNRAVFLEDWDRAQAWSARLRGSVAQACGAADPTPGLACDARANEVVDVTARLVALGLASPTTWQEALTAEAWRCHLAGEPHDGTSIAEAVWDGRGWAFGAWDRTTSAAVCLGGVRATPVVPEVPMRVRVTLQGG